MSSIPNSFITNFQHIVTKGGILSESFNTLSVTPNGGSCSDSSGLLVALATPFFLLLIIVLLILGLVLRLERVVRDVV